MGAEKGYHRVVDFRYCQFRFFIFCKGGLKFGNFSKIRKNPKIAFLEILAMKLSSYWFWCTFFVLLPLISMFWYHKYISLMLHWNFTSQNRRKIGPKMRPEVVICDFSYHSTFIMLHTYFQCVLLNETVLSSHSLRYSRIIVHFYVRSNLTGLHFGAKKAKIHVLWNLQHWKLLQLILM
jgi:hypothetical protein